MRKTFEYIFTEDDWGQAKNWSTDDILELLIGLIPDADYFYHYTHGSDVADEAKHAAKDVVRENPNHTFYMISDDIDIVHWVAFDDKYEPIFNAIKKYISPEFSLESFYLEDLFSSFDEQYPGY